jgi:lipopolysaccharide biosynthesis glycosyltransferase
MKTYQKSEPKAQPTKTKRKEKTSNEILHISMCFDDKYLTPFTVLLTSIIKNNESNPIHVHAIATGLSGREKSELKTLLNDHGGDIIYYQVSDERVKNFHLPKTSHMSISAYYRLCIAGMVPANVEKLLYLDTDIIVNGSLAGIFTTEMGNFAAAAVTEFSSNTVRPELGITSADMYFNSGVLLINVEQWKKQQISEKAISFILNNPEKLIWGDQDALNSVFAGNYIRLGAENNVIHSDVPINLNRAGFRKFLEDKTIIHYTLNRNKPWNQNCKSEIRFLYFDYLWQSTCWKESFRLNWAFNYFQFRKKLILKRAAFLNISGELIRRLSSINPVKKKTVPNQL